MTRCRAPAITTAPRQDMLDDVAGSRSEYALPITTTQAQAYGRNARRRMSQRGVVSLSFSIDEAPRQAGEKVEGVRVGWFGVWGGFGSK
jgi:hypothetical protein